MANTKSIQKILNYLRENQEAITPSALSLNVHLKWNTIQECLDFLKQSNQIEFLASDTTTLIKIKKENNQNARTK